MDAGGCRDARFARVSQVDGDGERLLRDQGLAGGLDDAGADGQMTGLGLGVAQAMAVAPEKVVRSHRSHTLEMEMAMTQRTAGRDWNRENTPGDGGVVTGGGRSAGRTRSVNATATEWVARALGAFLLFLASAAAPAVDLLGVFGDAIVSDPEFLAASADNRAVREVRTQAASGLLPRAHISLETAWNERDRRDDYRSESIVLDIEHSIYRRDRRIALNQADRRIEQADALYAAARQALIVRVAERYFGVLETQDDLSSAQATREAFEQQLTESRKRFEVGMIAITDVEEAQAGYDLSKAQLIAAENALDIAHEALRETTGEYSANLAPLGEVQLVMPAPADIDQWTEVALERNLRLLAARHDAEIARQEIERIEAGHYPTLDVVASLGFNDSESRAGDNRLVNVGLRLNLPLYTGGSVVSRTRESRHRYQYTLEALERERRRVQRETREAYLGVNSGISRVRALEQAVRSSEAAANAIDTGFQVGIRTSVDVLESQRDLFRALRDLSKARYRYILDLLRLKRAAGILSEDDLRLISDWLKE